MTSFPKTLNKRLVKKKIEVAEKKKRAAEGLVYHRHM